MDKDKNIEIQVDGVKIGLRFTTWSMRQTQIALGKTSVSDYFISLSNTEIDTILYTFLEAAREYAAFKKEDFKLDLRGVSEIVDSLGGLLPSIELITSALKQYDPNQAASQMEGQQVTV